MLNISQIFKKIKKDYKIGTKRFELLTFRSQSERATRLRYVPLLILYNKTLSLVNIFS